MSPTQIIATATAALALISSVWVGLLAADERYAQKSAVDALIYGELKEDIRNIRRDLRERPNDENLQDDLREAIDELCYLFPEDRECE